MNLPTSSLSETEAKDASIIVIGSTSHPGAVDPAKILERELKGVGKTVRVVPVSEALKMRDVPVILFYERAEEAITQALTLGKAPNAALSDWQTRAELLVKGYRANRRGIVMLEVNSFLATPGAFGPCLSDRLGISLSITDAGAETRGGAQDPIYRVIAAAAVNEVLAVRRLDGELEAGALWPKTDNETGYPRPVSAEAAFAACMRDRDTLKASTATLTQLQAGQQGKDLLQDQLVHVQEHLESEARAQREHAAQLDKRTAQLQAAELGKDLLQQQLENIQQELEIYFQDLAKLQKQKRTYEADLKAMYEKNQRCKIEIAELQKYLDKSRAELADAESRLINADLEAVSLKENLADRDAKLDALHSSTSWRVTSPIRSVGDKLKGSKKRN